MKIYILHDGWFAARVDQSMKSLYVMLGEGFVLRNQRKLFIKERHVEISFINKNNCREWRGKALDENDVLLTMSDFLGYSGDHFIDLRSYFAHGRKLMAHGCLNREEDLLRYVSYIVKGVPICRESS